MNCCSMNILLLPIVIPLAAGVLLLAGLADVTAAGGEARITLLGATRALVENCRGILEITPERVRLATRRGCVCFTGEALSVCEAREDALTVRGQIADIALPCEGRREGDA